MTCSAHHIGGATQQDESLLARSRKVINVLMDSPLYFFLPLMERKEILERIMNRLNLPVNT